MQSSLLAVLRGRGAGGGCLLPKLGALLGLVPQTEVLLGN